MAKALLQWPLVMALLLVWFGLGSRPDQLVPGQRTLRGVVERRPGALSAVRTSLVPAGRARIRTGANSSGVLLS